MDPHLDGTHDIATGLRTAPHFPARCADLGLPTATELLNPITPQYIADLICWSAIGARTAAARTPDGLGSVDAAGLQNGTDGSSPPPSTPSRRRPNRTRSSASTWTAARRRSSRGNPDCHVVLRRHFRSAIRRHIARRNSSGQGRADAVIRSTAPTTPCPAARTAAGGDAPTADPDRGGQPVDHGGHAREQPQAGNQPFPQPKDRLRYGVSIDA